MTRCGFRTEFFFANSVAVRRRSTVLAQERWNFQVLFLWRSSWLAAVSIKITLGTLRCSHGARSPCWTGLNSAASSIIVSLRIDGLVAFWRWLLTKVQANI